MKKIILFLITITTFTNVSYASFPVVEKVSNQTTGSNVPLWLQLMTVSDLIILTIVVGLCVWFLGFLSKIKQRTGGRGQTLLAILAIPLILLLTALIIIWLWIGLGCIIGFC
jgi:cellulose synthase/poly-beta-1,6-N-acetylglucosamine synthase-like glycosyltransferase